MSADPVELLLRIGAAAIRVDELRGRKAAAKRARNKIRCRRECNTVGGPRRLKVVPACWKNPAVFEGVESECTNCRRRAIRQRAFTQAARELAGGRRRVTMLARRFRREFPGGEVDFGAQLTTGPNGAGRRTR